MKEIEELTAKYKDQLTQIQEDLDLQECCIVTDPGGLDMYIYARRNSWQCLTPIESENGGNEKFWEWANGHINHQMPE